jgi:hypothetical protein
MRGWLILAALLIPIRLNAEFSQVGATCRVNQGTVTPTLPFDTTGATTIAVVATANLNDLSGGELSMTVGGVVAPTSWVQPFGGASGLSHISGQVWYGHPTTTGAMTVVTLTTPQPFGAGVMCVLAMSGTDQMAPVFQTRPAGQNTSVVNAVSSAPSGSLVIALLSSAVPLVSSPSPPWMVNQVGQAGGTYGAHQAWRVQDAATETASWTLNSSQPTIWAILAFAPGNVTPPPSGHAVILGGGIL